MPEPIQLPDGTVITNYDANIIEVTGPGGGTARVARAAAPPRLQQAVSQAETAPAPLATMRAQRVVSPTASMPPGMNIPAAAMPVTTGQDVGAMPSMGETTGTSMPSSPMAAVDAEIARLRQQGASRGPGGMATRTATSTTRMPDAAAAEVREMQTPIDEAAAEREIAIEDQAAVEERGMGEVSKLHAQQGQRIEQEAKDQETLRANYGQRFATEQQKLADLNAQAQTEIDPKRYWKEAGTGDKILAVISQALGGYVEGLTGGRVQNRAPERIQAIIQRDIDAQLENRARAERDVGRQAGMVGLLGDKYSDDIQKRQAAMILGNEAVAKQIEGIAAGMQAETAKARALGLAAELRQGNAQRSQEFAAQIAGSETVQTQQVPVAGGNRGQREADALSAAAYGPGATFDHKAYVPSAYTVTGEHRAANDPGDAVKINQQATSVQEMLRKTEQIEAIAKRGGKLSPQAARDVESLRASLTLDVKNLYEAGALDAGTQEITQQMLGPKQTDLTTTSNTMPRLRETIRGGFAATLRNRTHAIDPTTIPLAAKQQRGGTGIATQAPATRPLAEDSPE